MDILHSIRHSSTKTIRFASNFPYLLQFQLSILSRKFRNWFNCSVLCRPKFLPHIPKPVNSHSALSACLTVRKIYIASVYIPIDLHWIPGHFAVGEYIDEETLQYLQLMRQDIYYEYCVGMSYKTWPFKSMMDLLILRIAESGIQKYWELQVIYFYFSYSMPHAVFPNSHSQTISMHDNSKIQLGISISRHRENQGPISMKPKHLIGVFIIWAFGMSVSLAVFLVEQFGRKFENNKRIRMNRGNRFALKQIEIDELQMN